ncbi:TVP38/TMEM64 family protein [Tardiphaga sp. vice352]|uniref:TVP38/TMEM64 family protein n=1 Tax=unclassified Tardiphaga TaxID=2631404 RepID=UPI0011648A8A|nr:MULTISPECIES: VTT domain-containing protein [unclassified Tardiphaga]QDM17928.1 TVP38/TMEM64 family protein [Tardiphaga sp. vice278]QDM33290.1 TVP38/TMEM64 family protein [Tardiphaga sp. vice352]
MNSEAIVRWLESFGQLDAAAAAVLAAVFVVAAFVPMPRTFLVLGSGAAFGLQALWVIVPSTTLGCVLAFLLARGVLRGWVEAQTGKKPLWGVLAQAIDDEGWRIAALMRFWGPAPNCVQNYLFGLTRIGLVPYAMITLIFTLPQILLYTWIGASGRAILLDDGELPLSLWMMAIAATVVLTIVLLVSRRIRKILTSREAVLPASAGTRRSATS